MNHNNPTDPFQTSTTHAAVEGAAQTWETTTTKAAVEGAAQAWETTKAKAGEALQSGGRYVQDNPGTSVLSVFGGGLLLGVLIGWSLATEEKDDYAESARKFFKRWGHKLNLD